jgi:tRNA/tmRNA/rRNA uracil-C5-methylase (TrmA/RlmC/RlmD family)
VAAVLGRNGLAGASLAVLDPPRMGVARPVIDLLSAPSPASAETRGGQAATRAGGPAVRAGGPAVRAGGPAVRAGGPGRVGRIAYVSCDPATLARDIALLCASGWSLDALRAFDAFPMTHHVECLATLTRGP